MQLVMFPVTPLDLVQALGRDGITVVLVVKHAMDRSQRLAELAYIPSHSSSEPVADWWPRNRMQPFLSIDYDAESRLPLPLAVASLP